MFDLEAFRRWDRQVDHGNDEIVEGAIAEIEMLREALWRARADLDNAHREIMPHVHKLACDAMRISLIVDPPLSQMEPSSE